VHENNKAIRFWRTEAERAQKLDDAEWLPPGLDTEPVRQTTPTKAVMEYFGKAVAELLECSSCYVAVMSHATGSELE
jgi:hypothetical protein